MSGKTIQDAINSGDSIWAWCYRTLCGHGTRLDLLALRDRLGPDHGVMHDDLAPKLRCTKCNGVRGRDIGIRITPGTKEYGGNPYAKARGGR